MHAYITLWEYHQNWVYLPCTALILVLSFSCSTFFALNSVISYSCRISSNVCLDISFTSWFFCNFSSYMLHPVLFKRDACSIPCTKLIQYFTLFLVVAIPMNHKGCFQSFYWTIYIPGIAPASVFTHIRGSFWQVEYSPCLYAVKITVSISSSNFYNKVLLYLHK